MASHSISGIGHIQGRLKAAKSKYAVIAVVKTCTDAFTLRARFGQRASCPFCDNQRQSIYTKYDLKHIITCRRLGQFLLNCLNDEQRSYIDGILLSDPSCMILKLCLATAYVRGKKRDQILTVFACLARLIAVSTAQPELSPCELYSFLSQIAV